MTGEKTTLAAVLLAKQLREAQRRAPPTHRSQRLRSRSVAMRWAKDQAAQEARSAPAATGYCCPKCHTWHPTPEARKTCRESHHHQLMGVVDEGPEIEAIVARMETST